MKTPKVRDYMSPTLASISTKMTLEEADEAFLQHRVSTLPVMTPAGAVVAVMSDFGLLSCLLKRHQGQQQSNTVGSYLTDLESVFTIEADEPVVNALQVMIQSPSHRIYVTEKGVVKGALSPKDLLGFFLGDSSRRIPNTEEDRRSRELVRAELNRLRKKLDDYEAVFDHSPYMMHSLDMRGNILMANQMLHSVLGYNPGELVGMAMEDIYPSSFHKEAMEGLMKVKALGYHPLVNVLMVKKNKELVKVDIATTLKRDARGLPESTITIGRLSDSSAMLEHLQRVAR